MGPVCCSLTFHLANAQFAHSAPASQHSAEKDQEQLRGNAQAVSGRQNDVWNWNSPSSRERPWSRMMSASGAGMERSNESFSLLLTSNANRVLPSVLYTIQQRHCQRLILSQFFNALRSLARTGNWPCCLPVHFQVVSTSNGKPRTVGQSFGLIGRMSGL